METPKFDKNSEKWCGYFKNAEEAQKHLDHELKCINKYKLIVSAKKELGDAKAMGLFLYKFLVITADKDT
jgi:hypothetical protein